MQIVSWKQHKEWTKKRSFSQRFHLKMYSRQVGSGTALIRNGSDPRRKGLEVRTRKGFSEAHQGAAFSKSTEFRLEAGAPRWMTTWLAPKDPSHFTGQIQVNGWWPMPGCWSHPIWSQQEMGPIKLCLEDNNHPTLTVYLKDYKFHLEYLKRLERKEETMNLNVQIWGIH